LKLDLTSSILTPEEQIQLKNLISQHESIFSKGGTDLGHTNIVQHVIQLKDGVTPVRSRPYPVPDNLKPILRQQINDLLQAGVITQSTAPNFTSPILFVKKKDGGHRLCVDYRALNERTVKNHQMLPTIPDVANVLAHRRYFSALDLASGFWQIEMDQASRELTTFVTPIGVFKWNRMPFGLSGAPATFQRLMNAVLADFVAKNEALVYIDDILLTSTTFVEHLSLLRRVFRRLKEAGLKLKLSKASWCGKEIIYLGHTISESGFAPSPENTKRLKDYPSPTSVKETQRVLGLLSYYRRHISDFAKHAAPLHDATKKSKPFKWTDDCERSLRYLIEKVTNAPVLRFPVIDGRSQYILTTDASGVSVAAALAQIQEGVEYPIAFFSRSLNETERRWCSAEMEVAAIVAGINHFRQYLLGAKFTIYTDNAACVQILKKPNLSGKLHRWSLMIQDFDFEIYHKEGRLNRVCDALSRVKVNKVTSMPPDDEIRVSQRHDKDLAPIIEFLLKGTEPEAGKRESFERECANFEILDGLLYRKQPENVPVIVIPDLYKEVMLHRFHASREGMHLGVDKTAMNLSSVCYWKGMRSDIQDYIRSCDSCARVKNPNQRIRVPMKNFPPSHVLETVCSDLCGPFPVSDRGNRWIVVFTDQFSKFCEIQAMPDATAETLAKVYVEEFVTRYGTPINLLSDQGSNYMSSVMKKVNEMLEIKHKRTSPYHPATNGQAERLIKLVKFCLAHVVSEDQQDWDTYLGYIRMAVNQSWHAATNTSPAYVFFGRSMMTPTKLLLPRAPAPPVAEGRFAEMMEQKMQNIWDKVRKYLQISKQAQKIYYDRKLVPANLDVGDRVYKYDPRGKPGLATKLLQHWVGPYIVTKISDTNAWIRPIARPYQDSKCVHLNLLKKYSGNNVPPEESEVYDDEVEDEEAAPSENDDHQETSESTGDLLLSSIEELDPGEEEREVAIETEQAAEGVKRRSKPRRDPDFLYY
jgi:transposase InsO family protein